MNPSDTHIDSMADLFADRFPWATPAPKHARASWHNALKRAQHEGTLEEIEDFLSEDADTEVREAWENAR